MSDLTIPTPRDISLGAPRSRDTAKSAQLNIDDHSIRRLRIRTGRFPNAFSATDESGIWSDIRLMSAYYSVIAGAVSKLPDNTRDARLALYDVAEIALTSELLQQPEISDEQLAVQRLALEWAIRKIESAVRKKEQPEQLEEKEQRPFTSFLSSSGLTCPAVGTKQPECQIKSANKSHQRLARESELIRA
jgi:hypothetical protein